MGLICYYMERVGLDFQDVCMINSIWSSFLLIIRAISHSHVTQNHK